MKKVLLVIAVFIFGVAVTLFAVELFDDHDDAGGGWMCIDGEWAKQGNPSASHPNKDCKLLDDLKQEELGQVVDSLVPYGDAIQLREPVANQVVVSPLKVTGNVLAGWTFEASFPIRLIDANGKVIASAPGNAPGWTEGGWVPFEGILIFDAPVTATGILRLSNDNASGLPENDKWVDVPVSFVLAPTASVK